MCCLVSFASCACLRNVSVQAYVHVCVLVQVTFALYGPRGSEVFI